MRIIIEPGRTEKNYWRDLWLFRELFYILAWRDIKVKYKQTFIGLAWSLLRPILTATIFTLVFNRVAKLDAPENVPYILLVFAGMLPWTFFSNALAESSNSLITNTSLITKVYFPRMIIPISTVISGLLDFAITLIMLFVLMVFYQVSPSWQILLLPFFIFLAFVSALGLGLYITALNVKYRDFRYIIPFVVQFGLYITPVGFSSDVVSPEWRLLYSINPMVGVVDGFRWSLLGLPLYLPGVAMSIAVTIIFIVLGIWYFRKTERSFADNI